MKTKTLTSDPRWREFRDKFAFNLSKFLVEVCGFTPTWQQFEVCDSISPSGSRTSVSSGHGTGKSRICGGTAWWHLTCYANSNMLITAPKIEQVRNVIWKEIKDIEDYIRAQKKYAWILEYTEIKDERFYIKGRKNSWYVIAKTAPKGSPENMAGMHRKWLLIWGDEATGIPDGVFPTLTGALTDKRNRFVLTSQFTRDIGFFADTQTKNSTQEGGEWNAITLNSEESPLVSEEWLVQRIREYGGRSNPEYQVRVLGICPDKSDENILGRAHINKILNKRIFTADDIYGIVITVDVAAGEFRDKSCVTIANVSGDVNSMSDDPRKAEVIKIPLYSNTRDVDFLTAFVFNLYQRIPDCVVVCDAGGLGVQVCQKLEKNNVALVRVNWGKPPINLNLKERFRDRRGMATYLLARAIKENRFAVAPEPSSYSKEIIAQGSKLPYFYDEKFRLYIMSKPLMKEKGIPSPDMFDTFTFLFLEEVYFNLTGQIIDNDETIEEQTVTKRIDAAFDAFSDVE